MSDPEPEPEPEPEPDTGPIPSGYHLEGREIIVEYEDGIWYDAVVIRYYNRENEYKIVYRADDGIEIIPLTRRRWILAPRKKLSEHDNLVLDGCILEFVYPADQKKYKAMVYDYSENGMRLKVAYINEHSTDYIKGGGWVFLSESPCKEDARRRSGRRVKKRVGGSTEVEFNARGRHGANMFALDTQSTSTSHESANVATNAVERDEDDSAPRVSARVLARNCARRGGARRAHGCSTRREIGRRVTRSNARVDESLKVEVAKEGKVMKLRPRRSTN